MIQPPFLKVGDKIAITATARKLTPKSIQNGLNAALHFGFEPIISKTVGAEQNIFAGDDSERAQELQGYLDNPEIKAIWLARGGYGTIRMLEKIDWTAFNQNPKWLVGFSDVTNLLATVNNASVAAIHGPMAQTIPNNFTDDASTNLLFATLSGSKSKYEWKASKHCSTGAAQAKVVGGNLATLANMYPSLNADFFDNKILFIEEIDEYKYQIDRMLRGMKMSGRLNGLKGLVLGDFSGIKDNEDQFGARLQEIISNVFADLNIPIAFGFKAGHENVNWPITFGAMHELKMQDGVWSLQMT